MAIMSDIDEALPVYVFLQRSNVSDYIGSPFGSWIQFFLCKMIMAGEREHQTSSSRKNRLFTPVRQDSSRADRCVKLFNSPDQIQSFLPHDLSETRKGRCQNFEDTQKKLRSLGTFGLKEAN
ncbi:PREDICTED: uncharacterized protein LOC108776468 [Cyphomyrmex costatus]|uniref:uncharacterized protein LOC108776468 n=1 Tax=Cyphomyrmex costatus TaxID=456900 RepID=UPI0008521DB6|nr:PREDICTED: uncharacterized protein LOC108776468 [Cyphomyrmex costatus]